MIDISTDGAKTRNYAMNPENWLKHCEVSDADLVVLAAGEHLFSYTAKENFDNLFWRTLPAFGAKAAGKRCVIMPSTFGPFETDEAKALMEQLLRTEPRIAARDARSAEIMRNFSLSDCVELCLDPVFFIPSPPAQACFDGPPTIGLIMQSDDWGAEDRKSFKENRSALPAEDIGFQFSLAFCRRLLSEGDCAVKIFVQTDVDHAIAEAISADLGKSKDVARLHVVPVKTIDAYLNELNTVDFVVSSRFHGLILGMVCGKPGFGAYFDVHGHKIPRLMDLLGQPENCINLTKTSVDDAVDLAFSYCVDQRNEFGALGETIDRLRCHTLNWLGADWEETNSINDHSMGVIQSLLSLALSMKEAEASDLSAQAYRLGMELETEKVRAQKFSQQAYKFQRLQSSVSYRALRRLVSGAKRLVRVPLVLMPRRKNFATAVVREEFVGAIDQVPINSSFLPETCKKVLEASPPYQVRKLAERQRLVRQKARSRISLIRHMRKHPAPTTPPKIRKKGVLYLLHNCMPFHSGGYALRAHGLLKGMQNAGWDVVAQARAGYPSDRKGNIGEVLDRELIDGVEYRFLQNGTRYDQMDQVEYVEKYAEAVLSSVETDRIGVVQAPSFFQSGMAGRLIADRLGVPLVYEMRGLEWFTNGSLTPDWKRSMHRIISREVELEAARTADHVFAITGALKSWLINHGLPESKVSLLPNGSDPNSGPAKIDEAACKALSHKLGLEGAFVVGYVGTVAFYEGIELIIEAISKARVKTGLDIRFLLVGDGGDLSRVCDFAGRTGALRFVHAVGRVPHREVDLYYRLIDTFVMARTDLEICQIISPLKPLEVMMKGKLLITSDVAAIREMINASKGGALMFKAGDVAGLAERIIEAACNPDRMQQVAARGRAWSVEKRNWNVLVGQALQTLEQRFGVDVSGREH